MAQRQRRRAAERPRGGLFRTLKRFFVGTFFVAAFVAGVAAVLIWRSVSADLPPVDRILHYRPPTATRVYADDGTQIGEFFFERRYLVPLERVPPLVRAAFISAEDANFFRHRGVDVISIVRAMLRNLQQGTVVQGGSTITQQVVKSLLLSPERSYERKAREMILAFRLERQLTKEEILYLYLNQVYFGNGAYGIAAAARTYFGKEVDDLTLAEGTLLAGLLQAPSSYSPVRHPQRAKARQRYVLERMEAERYITGEQRVAVLQEDIVLGSATAPAWERAPHYLEHVRRVLEERYGGSAPYQMGLRVYTAVNVRMQAAAEAAIREGLDALDAERHYSRVLHHLEENAIDPYLHRQGAGPFGVGRVYNAVVTAVHPGSVAVRIGEERGMLDLEAFREPRKLRRGDVLSVITTARTDDGWLRVAPNPQPPVEGALVAMDPATGEVKSMVGGYDFGNSQFNRAVQSMRQPGSSFKPIVYAAALDRGYTPASLVFDGPITLPNGSLPAWAPRNYNERYYGWTTLRNALVHSLNTVTVRIVDSIGLNALMDTIQDFRLFRRTPPRNLSIALGSAEVTLLKLTQTYAVFAADGQRPAPIFITRIEDSEGRVLEEARPHFDRVLNPATAYLVTNMMQAVVERGTGQRARTLGRPCAGKTGTTNDYRDAWFLGFTPELVAGIWVGFDSKLTLGDGVTGGRVATPIWAQFMERALEGHPIQDFRIPPDVTFVNVDDATGLRAVVGRASGLEVFRRGTEPMRYPHVEEAAPPPPQPAWDFTDDGTGAPAPDQVPEPLPDEIEEITFSH
jgi:penicillin-binding protein 1A